MKAGNPRADFLRFYYIHFFSRRNPSLPYGCTATKRIFDDSAHFYLIHFGGLLKKCRPKISLTKISTLNKVFARLLGKAAPSKARSLCRAPQSAKSLPRRFLFDSFFFCACICKRKSEWGFNLLLWLFMKFGF